jgi:hypothetical protein
MKLLSHEEVADFLRNANLELLPRQSKLSLPILQRIHFKMKVGVDFSAIQVCENIIVNGHHRYICAEILNLQLDQTSWALPLHSTFGNWQDVEITPDDFDDYAQIVLYNTLDAKRCNLDPETFNTLLNSN